MRLAELEYLLVHGGSRGHLLQYELSYDGAADDEPRLAGLIEPEALDNDEGKLGHGDSKLVSGCPQDWARLMRPKTMTGNAWQVNRLGLAKTRISEKRRTPLP